MTADYSNQDPDCNKTEITNFTNYKYNSDTDCPNKTCAIISLILLILYVVILATMLINLLIAIFK